MEYKIIKSLVALFLIAVSISDVSSFKVKLGTDGIIDQETGIMEITMENQMDNFMDRDHIIGEWLAYFENTKLCKGNACKDGLNEIKKFDRMLQGKLRIAKINW